MKKIGRPFILAILVVGILAIVTFELPTTYQSRVSTALQVLFMGFLAVVTAYYADKTAEISESTKKQAKATATSVAEMVKQRQLSTQPWVFPALFLEQETSGPGGALYEEAPPSLVSFRNLGNGAAINVEVTVSEESTVPSKAMILVIQEAWKRRQLGVTQKRSGPTWPFIDRGQRVLWVNAFESPKEGETGIILVEYRDIYGTEFLSGWAYRFARVQGERLALTPGEPLYPVSRS